MIIRHIMVTVVNIKHALIKRKHTMQVRILWKYVNQRWSHTSANNKELKNKSVYLKDLKTFVRNVNRNEVPLYIMNFQECIYVLMWQTELSEPVSCINT